MEKVKLTYKIKQTTLHINKKNHLKMVTGQHLNNQISSREFCNQNWGLNLRQKYYKYERRQGTPVTMQQTIPVWPYNKLIKSKNDDVTTVKEFIAIYVNNE